MTWVARFLATVVMAGLLASCAAVSLRSSWKDPTVTPRPYTRILVVGVAKDEGVRRMFEEIFVSELKRRGVDAIPSFSHFPITEPIDREKIVTAVQLTRATAVIATKVSRVETIQDYGPQPVAPWDFTGNYYAGVGNPPVAVTFTEATLETKLFDAETGRMVWVANTSTFDGNQAVTVSVDLSQVIVEKLRKDGFI